MRVAIVPLSEAAARLGCHPETLRRRIRAGRLEPAGRGLHGEYLISLRSLASVRLSQGGRPRRRQRSSEARIPAEVVVRIYRMWALSGDAQPIYQYILDVLHEPNLDPEFSRFLDFWRLRTADVSTRRAGRRLGLPAHVAEAWAAWDREHIEEVVISRIRRRGARLRHRRPAIPPASPASRPADALKGRASPVGVVPAAIASPRPAPAGPPPVLGA